MDLVTLEVRRVFDPMCQSYVGCFKPLCLTVGHPFWLDSETILFWRANVFPVSTPNCSSVGREHVQVVVRTDGTVIETDGLAGVNYYDQRLRPEGGTLISHTRPHDLVTWFDAADLIRGIATARQVPEVGRNLSLSPDGRFLLDFPERVIELRSGRVTRLDAWQDPVSSVDRCVWAPDGGQITCLFRAGVSGSQLIWIPRTGERSIVLQSEDQGGLNDSAWTLITWL